jgi:lysylphosphatidylglycerol synthetase-like protein (DUF2156 family)
MMPYVILVLALIIGGLVVCLLSKGAGNPTLVTLFWWVGIIVAVCGLVLALEPLIHWAARNLREMIGA